MTASASHPARAKADHRRTAADADLWAAGKRSDDPAAASVTIACLSKRTGASYRALRHYETVGLLSPVRRGAARFYTPHQCARAALIVALRRLDVSLPDLPPLIDFDRPAQDRIRDLEAVLERRAAELEAQLDAVQRALARRRGGGSATMGAIEAPDVRRVAL